MKFVPVRDLRIKPSEVWKKLSEEKNIVITSNGRPKALLTEVEEDTLEESLVALRRARALMALERIQRLAVASDLSRMTEEKIEAEIRAVRRARKK